MACTLARGTAISFPAHGHFAKGNWTTPGAPNKIFNLKMGKWNLGPKIDEFSLCSLRAKGQIHDQAEKPWQGVRMARRRMPVLA